MCGDSTDSRQVKQLLGDRRVDQLLTDPPYGVNYAAKNEMLNKFDKGNRVQTPIENDNITDYRAFFAAFLGCIPFADYNTVYVFMAGQELHSARLALDDAGIKWGDYLVWLKNNHVLGRKDYNAKHEFVVYGWKGKHKFYGDFSTTVLEYNKPQKNELHPTMKPVELIARLMADGSTAAALVYDPFLGSGTTLIAAEQLGRTCYGLEIDPHYVDVIIKRWEQLTGKEAELVQNQ
jgi:DNA modification methylase